MSETNMTRVKALLLTCGATLCVASCGDSKAGSGENDAGRGERDVTLSQDTGDTTEPRDIIDARDIPEVFVDTAEPQAPTADAGGDRGGVPNISIAFDGSRSSDPDGDVIRYEWAFGNGDTATGVVTNYAYENAGVFTVTLTVTDNDGLTDTDEIIVDLQEANEPPQAVIDGPFEVVAGEENEWNALRSTDDIAIRLWTWDLGVEGEPEVLGQRVEYRYRQWGVYTMTLTVEDTDGVRDISTQSVDVLAPPTAFFEGPAVGFVGEELEWDGTLSFDDDAEEGAPNNGIVRWTWDWDDGTPPLVGPPFGRHTYTEPGRYDVIVTVEDADGIMRASASKKLDIFEIPNVAPTPVISAERFTVDECQSLAFDASLSVDDTDTPSTLRYVWDFGDGSTISGQSVEHDWRRDGEYTVTLTAIDSDEASGEAEIVVTVNNLQPTAAFTLTPTSVLEEETVLADASGSVDGCDGEIATYAWDWGDGTQTPASGSPVGSHTYEAFGEYDVRLTIVDDGETPLQDEAERSIEVIFDAPNQAPIPVISASDFTVDECGEVDFGASLTVDDSDGPLDLIYLWDFGDGSSQSGIEVDHDWEREGEYEVTLAVIDSEGARGEASVFITVENIAPTAIFNALPAPVPLGSSLNVDANASFDGCEGSIIRYRYDWGDGTLGTGTPSPVASHTYDAVGTYPVTLTVVDDGDPAIEVMVQQNISVVEGGGGPTRYVATPAINHQCAGGNVNVRLATAQIVDAAGVVTVEATGEQPGNMSSDLCATMACSGVGDSAVCVCSSQLTGGPGCNEFYEMSLIANPDGSYDYEFDARFEEVDNGFCSILPQGCCLGCTSYSTSGTFVPE